MLRLTAVLCALFGVNGANAQTCTSLCDSLPATVEWSSVTDCAVEFSLSFVSDSDGEALDAANAIWELNGNEVATGAQCAIPAAEVQAGGTLVVTRSGLDAFADCSCSQTISLAEVSDDMVWPCSCHPFQGTQVIEYVSEDACIPVHSALSVSTELGSLTHVAFDWSIQGGDFEFDTETHAGSMEPSVVFLEATSYQVAVQLTDTLTGCTTWVAPTNVSMQGAPTVSILNELEVCAQEEGTLEVLVNPGNTALTSFEWITEGVAESLQFPAPLTQGYETSGLTEVVALSQNACGIGTDTTFVLAHPSPVLEVSTSHNWYCLGSYVDIEATGEGEFLWNSSSELLSDGQPGDSVARYVVGSQVVGSVFTTVDHGNIQCSTSQGFAVYGFFVPSISLELDDTYCIGDTVAAQANIVSYGWDTAVEWILNGEPVDTTLAPTASVGASTGIAFAADELGIGAQTLEAALTFFPYPTWLPDYGCANNVSQEIEVKPLPVVTAPSSFAFCDQSFIETLPDGVPSGGTWSGLFPLENNEVNPANFGVGNHELIYTYSDEFGCSALDTSSMTISPPVSAQAVEDTTLCESNDLIQLPLVGGFETEYWEGVGITDPSSGLLDLGELVPGYWNLVHHLGSGSCATSDTALWHILEQPTVFLSTEGSVACDGDTVWMNVFAGGGTLAAEGEYTYDWTDEVTLTSSGEAYWIADLNENFTIIGLTVTDDLGCADDATTFITPMALPDITIPELTSECAQDIEVPLPLVSPNGGYWEGEGIVDSSGVFNPGIGGVGSFVLTYTGQNSLGCTNSDTVVLEVISAPEITVMDDVSVCANEATVTLLAVTPLNGIWSGPGIAGVDEFSPTAAGVGEHALVYQAGVGSCAVSDTVWASVTGLPEISIAAPEWVCAGDSSTVTATVNGDVANHQLIWSGASSSLESEGWLLVTEAWEEGDQPNISFSVVNEFGCVSDFQSSWSVASLPNVVVPPIWTVCQSDSAAALPDAEPMGGTWTGPGIADAAFNATMLNSGGYAAVYSAVDANGCVGQDSMEIIVSAVPELNLETTLAVCFGDTTVSLPTPENFEGDWEGPAIVGDTASTVAIGSLTPGTYMYTFSHAGPVCSVMDSVELVVHSLPVVEPMFEAQACPDSTVSLGVNVSGSSAPYLATWTLNGQPQSGNNLAIEVAWSTPGIQEVMCTVDDELGCSAAAEWLVDILEPVEADIDSMISVCNQDISIELSDFANFDASTQVWYTGVGTSEGAIAPDGQLNPASLAEGEYQVEVLFQSETGCNALDTAVIVVSIPEFVETALDTSVCALTGLHVFNALPEEGAFTWSGTDEFSEAAIADSEAGLINVNALPSGAHSFAVSMGHATCLTTDTLTVHVTALPEIQWPALDVLCVDAGTVDFDGVQPAGGLWTGDGIIDAELGTFDPVAAGIGIHAVEYAVTDLLTQCSASDSMELQVVAPVQAEFSAPLNSCAGIPVVLNALSADQMVAASWWQADTLIGQGVSIEWLSEDDANIVLMTTDMNGCQDSTMQFLAWEHVPEAQVEMSAAAGCAPLDVSFQPSTDWDDVSWSWYIDGDLVSEEAAFDGVLDAESDSVVYAISLELNHACGVYQSMDSIVVIPRPVLDFSNTVADGCVEEEMVLAVESEFSDQLTWVLGGQPEVTADSLDVEWTNAGLYEVQVTATHLINGCSTEAEWIIEVHAAPDFTLSVDATEGCSPLLVQFSSEGSEAGWDWSWDFGDGSTGTGEANETHSYSNDGVSEEWVAVATVTDVWGCTGDASVSMEVYPQPETDWGLIPEEICGVPSTLILERGGEEVEEVYWNVNGELSALGDTVQLLLNQLGWNQIEQVVTNEFGCSASALDSIEVLALPSVSLSVQPMMGCGPLEVDVEANSNGVMTMLEITQSGNEIYAGQADSIIALHGDGSYHFELVSTSDRGCVNAVELADSVIVFPSPAVYFEAQPYSGTFEDPHPLNSTWTFENGSDAGQSIWDFGDGAMSSEWNGTHTYTAPGTYEVVLLVVNEMGCSNEWSRTIAVEENLQVFVPNAFTPPNAGYSDGVNDGWRPEVSAPDLVDRYLLRVFNRSGRLIWETQDPEAYWIGEAQVDGEFFGMNDVYTWVLRIDSRAQLPATQEWRGHVTLIR